MKPVFILLVLLISNALSGAELPNILFIMSDDQGYGDLGCYGAKDLETPNLDQLAAEGAMFTDFYANGPTCSPTRAGFLTGRYQQRIDLDNALTYQEMNRGLLVDGQNVVRDLKAKGYSTGLSGKWHLGYDKGRTPLDQGFDHFFGLLGGNHHYFQHMDRIGVPDLWDGNDPIKSDGYTTDLITTDAISFIRNHQGQPFFLYLAHAAPHFPFQGPGDRDKKVKPKTKSWQQGDRETYVAMVERMDLGIGKVLAELDKLSLREKTLVIFTSDNGGDRQARNAPFSGLKSTISEGGIRVPCLARWPGVISPGTVISQPTMTMDWSASIRRIAGWQADTELEDGTDLMPLLTGRDSAWPKRHLFWRRKNDQSRKVKNPGRAVRFGNWKYIENFGESPESLLFDLKKDPAENINLLGSHPEVADRLSKQLDRWEKAVDPAE